MPPLNPTAGARVARLVLYKEIALITIEFTKTKPILAEKMETESKRGFQSEALLEMKYICPGCSYPDVLIISNPR